MTSLITFRFFFDKSNGLLLTRGSGLSWTVRMLKCVLFYKKNIVLCRIELARTKCVTLRPLKVIMKRVMIHLHLLHPRWFIIVDLGLPAPLTTSCTVMPHLAAPSIDPPCCRSLILDNHPPRLKRKKGVATMSLTPQVCCTLFLSSRAVHWGIPGRKRSLCRFCQQQRERE